MEFQISQAYFHTGYISAQTALLQNKKFNHKVLIHTKSVSLYWNEDNTPKYSFKSNKNYTGNTLYVLQSHLFYQHFQTIL